MATNEETVLGFDYGQKRIGVAVGQSVTNTATPLTTVAVHNHRPDWKAIDALVKEWQPLRFVIGWPLNMDGSRQQMTANAERFLRQLVARYNVPAELADERLSTIAARERAGRSQMLDPVAAQIIVETFFAQSRHEQK